MYEALRLYRESGNGKIKDIMHDICAKSDASKYAANNIIN